MQNSNLKYIHYKQTLHSPAWLFAVPECIRAPLAILQPHMSRMPTLNWYQIMEQQPYFSSSARASCSAGAC